MWACNFRLENVKTLIIGGGKSHFKSLLGLCECLHVMFVMWGKQNKTSLRHVNISFMESEKPLNTNDNSLLISLSADGEISLKMSILRRRSKSVLILGVGQTYRIYWKRELLVSHFILQLLKPGCLIFYIVAMTWWYDMQRTCNIWPTFGLTRSVSNVRDILVPYSAASVKDNIDLSLAEMPFHPFSYFCQICAQSKLFYNVKSE